MKEEVEGLNWKIVSLRRNERLIDKTEVIDLRNGCLVRTVLTTLTAAGKISNIQVDITFVSGISEKVFESLINQQTK